MRRMTAGLLFGFAVGCFVTILMIAVLETSLSLNQTTFRQCQRTEIALQVMHQRSLAFIIMSC